MLREDLIKPEASTTNSSILYLSPFSEEFKSFWHISSLRIQKISNKRSTNISWNNEGKEGKLLSAGKKRMFSIPAQKTKEESIIHVKRCKYKIQLRNTSSQEHPKLQMAPRNLSCSNGFLSESVYFFFKLGPGCLHGCWVYCSPFQKPQTSVISLRIFQKKKKKKNLSRTELPLPSSWSVHLVEMMVEAQYFMI